MITVALTNRNRDLSIVKTCLDSLFGQTNSSFKVILVDYGSEEDYLLSFSRLVAHYPFVELLLCPVHKQLWNKSKAINIALQKCVSDYFFVGDIDMIFHKDFTEILHQYKSENEVTYFQVGFLSKEESQISKSFSSYEIKHLSNKEATGMSLFPTALLKSINGYEEFYHGWGAEDTDVHIRLQNKKVNVNFYDRDLLILHQWHDKTYRTSESKDPFHSHLEKINHHYLQQCKQLKRTKANIHFPWGVLPSVKDYADLNQPEISFSLTNEKNEIAAFLDGTLFECRGLCIELCVVKHVSCNGVKNKLNKMLGKKHLLFYSFQELNDMILLAIISKFRIQPYKYEYSKINQTISLKIKL